MSIRNSWGISVKKHAVSLQWLLALRQLNLIYKKAIKSKVFKVVVCATFLLVSFVCLKKSTCETRKNIFYITLKTLFVLEIIKF